jgi:hypothetical protein
MEPTVAAAMPNAVTIITAATTKTSFTFIDFVSKSITYKNLLIEVYRSIARNLQCYGANPDDGGPFLNSIGLFSMLVLEEGWSAFTLGIL